MPGKPESAYGVSEVTQQPRGLRISLCTGFVLAFLAVAVAIAVGLIVHFVEKAPETCERHDEVDLDKCREIAKDLTCHSRLQPDSKQSGHQQNDVRLPQTIKPLHYDLELRPNMYDGDPSTFTFNGYVKITMKCLQTTSDVTMHAKNLDISSGSIALWSNNTKTNAPQYVSHELDKVNERLRIHLSKNMDVNEVYFVTMNFSGPLTDGDLHGLYLSSYKRGNKTIFLAATQFESRSARKAFPCFDEPKLKSRFDITLVRKKGLSSISNMKIDHTEERESGFEADVYGTTPIMSTYLLAFTVSDFQYINGTTSRGLEYRAWGQKEYTDRLHYGLDAGMRTISHYENYFNISFPLPKQDMVALPNFAPGAMENWGCINFRAERLFFKEGETSSRAKQAVLIDITHELAHQWFGDLVTMEWWDDVWLNEGFATFFGFQGAEYIEPTWDMYNMFVTDQIVPVFDTDGRVTSHPVHPENTSSPYFDQISYNKGASVLRMLKFFVGDETFRRGLIRYLRSRAYGNANRNDLWQSLHEQAEEDKKSIDVVETMKTWTLQMNYPVVTVSWRGKKQLLLHQNRFLLDDSEEDPGTFKSPFDYKWNIPFTYTTSDVLNFNVTEKDIIWLLRTDYYNDNSLTLHTNKIVPNPRNGSGWVMANIGHHGFYRVNYEVENWRNIIKQLKQDHNVIIPINRAQIINDAIDLAKAGLLDQRLALGTLEYLSSELSYYPWKIAMGKLDHVDKMLRYTDVYGAFKAFMRNSSRNAFKHYGLDDPGTGHLDTFTRTEVVAAACRYSNRDCLREARAMFLAWKNHPAVKNIHPDLLKTVLCTGVSEGVTEDWFFLNDMYKMETMLSRKKDMMDALACSKEPWLMELYLQKGITPGEVRSSDATLPLSTGPALNPSLQPLLWDFVRKNYILLRDKFNTIPSFFGNMVYAATDTFNTDFQLQELEHFINSTCDLGVGDKYFKQAVKETKLNIKWMNDTFPVVKQWLTDMGYYG